MGIFDSMADTPGQIRAEGQTITLKFEQNGSDGLVTWNIPTPAFGCNSDTGEYSGIVITLDNKQGDYSAAPKDGVLYTADPTGDTDLHAGDKIETALVIGAFYHEKNIENKTTSLSISGLDLETPYYISAYAVDSQFRYHYEGVHAFSLDIKNNNATPDTLAYQIVDLDPGVSLSDGTGLVPGFNYTFKICINGTDHNITINGTNALSYQNLIDQLNAKIKLLSNGTLSPVPLMQGAYYWDNTNKKLYQWNGTTHIPVDVIVEATNPTNIAVGEYWYETDTNTLRQWDGAVWNVISSPIRIDSDADPLVPSCNTYWLDPTGPTLYNWNGDVWCECPLYQQSNDPQQPVEPVCGTYWYNTNTSQLFVWNTKKKAWIQTHALYWNIDPSLLPVGTLWVDTTNNKLFERVSNATAWDELDLTTSETEPDPTSIDQWWFRPSTQELFQRDALNATWLAKNAIMWGVDPANQESCDLWWDTDTDTLFVWDPFLDVWDTVSIFLQQANDPNGIPIIQDKSGWIDTDNNKVYVFECSTWVEIEYITRTIKPNIISLNDIWHNTETNKWFIWDGLAWVEFDPVDSINDPQTLPVGTLWFDTTNNALFKWNGLTWISVGFSLTPLNPKKGDLWFDTTNNELMTWNGSSWIKATPLATFFIDENGDLKVQTTMGGSNASVYLSNIDPNPLFSALSQWVAFCPAVIGLDGRSGTPQQLRIGVGDDGTADEKRDLIHTIRQQLGYPVVQVELTPGQYDIAIDNAIQSLRKRSSLPYKRAYFFLDIQPGKSSYTLTNKKHQWDKIVNIMGLRRMTSAFLSTAQGTGVYGQILLQQLYSMGTYDLLSYHLISQYIEEMEMLFATRLTFHWDEFTHELQIYHNFKGAERILVEATFERSYQEMLMNRFTSTWIQKFALAECKEMLSKIRGKFSTYPGAGGGLSFNYADLAAESQQDKEMLLQQLDDYIENDPENYGAWDVCIG